jgi:hypothetical protein
VVRAGSGERAAFEELFEASFRRVWAWALRHGAGRGDAEAVTREALDAAFARLAAASLPGLLGDPGFAAKLLVETRRALARRSSGAAPPGRCDGGFPACPSTPS